MFGFASLSVFEQGNSCLRRTAQLYTLTLPYTWLVKNLLKQMQYEGCERPKNEYFVVQKNIMVVVLRAICSKSPIQQPYSEA